MHILSSVNKRARPRSLGFAVGSVASAGGEGRTIEPVEAIELPSEISLNERVIVPEAISMVSVSESLPLDLGHFKAGNRSL